MPEPIRNSRMILAIAFLLLTCSAGAQTQSPQPTSTPLDRARLGIETLQGWYAQATGLYKTTGWWNSANAITVLVDYARASQSQEYDSVLANTFAAAQKTSPGFINQYYDDEGWWALAWIDAYDLTGNQQYLAMARSIFADMSGGWDDTCGGGIWWNKERHYKNAIANELFLSVAAHLANRDSAHRGEYLDWANREWKWFAASGMINGHHLINDGLTITATSAGLTCRNNGQTTWTYNQGVVLGGLTELSKLNSDPALPRAAQQIAAAAIHSLADPQGVLHDSCEPRCGADGVQFKGIFVRNLVSLALVFPKPEYASFVVTNADAIWGRAQGPNHQFGQVWSGPFGTANAGTQSSALDALVGAATLEKRE